MPKQRPAKRLRGRRRAQPSRACAPRVSVFPFLELAAETRLQVYEHLLHMPYAIDVSGLNVSILRANKQLHAETSHFFYSVNAFVLLEHQDDAKAAGSDLAGDDEYMGNNTSALLRALATQAPNLARLALVKEYQSDGYSIFTTGSGWNYHYRRRPLLNKSRDERFL
ncbi:hypothetical protein N0V88_007255 [Collariella sp. IMI 366227]|nr:hypothetical protein N0V88_007255 [Collariella sp. IMI 366227]